MFIAAIVHDFEHTGTSNNFHVQSRFETDALFGENELRRRTSRSDVALIYNDRAVLENHHVSAAFRLMRIDDYNILAEFTVAEYKWVERRTSFDGELFFLFEEFSTIGHRDGSSDGYELAFYSIENHEGSSQHAGKVRWVLHRVKERRSVSF
jgi:hypothetical protein